MQFNSILHAYVVAYSVVLCTFCLGKIYLLFILVIVFGLYIAKICYNYLMAL